MLYTLYIKNFKGGFFIWLRSLLTYKIHMKRMINHSVKDRYLFLTVMILKDRLVFVILYKKLLPMLRKNRNLEITRDSKIEKRNL